MTSDKLLILHQFEFSHFNEKARWALDYKDVEHKRTSYLPGPHMPAIKKLSGKTQTPVLEIDGEIISGSAAIIDRLESDYPTPALYPESEDLRVQALAMQKRFDKDLGPATRTILFSKLVDEGSYLCAMFARRASAPKRILYRATFPLARGLIAKSNGTTDPENVTRCLSMVDTMLDELAGKVEATGYLVGDKFCVADLSAAALLAPLANPEHVDMTRPKPVPESIAELIGKFADHPAITWVNKMYSLHRP